MRVPDRRLSTAPLLALTAIAVGLLGVAVVASRAHLFGESAPPLPLAASRIVLDSLFYLVVVLEALVLVLLVWVLWPDDSNRPPLKRRSLWHTLTAPLSVIALAGLILILRDRLRQVSPGLAGVLGRGQTAGSGPQPPGGPGLNSHSGFDWVAFAVVALIVLASVLLLVNHRRQLQRAERGRRRRLAAELAGVMTEGLDDLLGDVDPRRAVIAAYARMERVLAAHGIPRRPAEAPLEYVNRVLARMSLPASQLQGLTDLYLTARFSLREVDGGMRNRALDLLDEIRVELRERAQAADGHPAPLEPLSA